MPLKAVVDTLDGVPEGQRELYTEQNGKYVLQVADLDGHPAIDGLKRKNGELLGELSTLRSKFKPFEALDPARIEALLKAEDDQQRKKQQDAGDWDAREKALHDQYRDKEIGPRDARITTLTAALEREMVTARAIQAAEAEGAFATLLLPHLLPQLQLVEENGTFHVRVRDPEDPRKYRLGGADGSYMSISALVKEMRGKKEFLPLFKGSGANGSGAGDAPPGAPPAAGDPQNWTDKQRADYVAANGLNAFLALRGITVA
jgi:hypothetical protein